LYQQHEPTKENEMNTEAAREIQHHRDCYGATTEAPRLALPYGSTDRLVHAAIREGFENWNAGRVIHVKGCPEA
jgi:hypothetical protein